MVLSVSLSISVQWACAVHLALCQKLTQFVSFVPHNTPGDGLDFPHVEDEVSGAEGNSSKPPARDPQLLGSRSGFEVWRSQPQASDPALLRAPRRGWRAPWNFWKDFRGSLKLLKSMPMSVRTGTRMCKHALSKGKGSALSSASGELLRRPGTADAE